MRPDNSKVFTPSSTLKDLLALERVLRNVPQVGDPAISVRVSANFSSQFLARSIAASFVVLGHNPQVFDDPYDQWEQRLMALGDDHWTDWLLLALSTRPFVVQRRWEDPEALAAYIAGLISTYVGARSERILVMLPEYLPEATVANSWLHRWTSSLRSQMRLTLSSVSQVELFDPNLLISAVGADRWHSSTDWVISKFPLNPRLFPFLGASLASHVSSLTISRVKVIAVDFDNTLWGGEVGDLGPQGINLEPHAEGYGHLLLQRFLRDQKENGVTLIGLTKNQEAVARSVFTDRREMILRWEDFAVVKANFEPKSQNLVDALELLGLSDAGLVFLDDSKFEIEEVRRRFPDVWTHEFPTNFHELTEELTRTGLFGRGQVTEVSLQRTSLYRQEMKRRELSSKVTDLDSFLSGLHMKLSFEPLRPGNLTRVSELLSRTNQFNLTKMGLTSAELRELTEQKNPGGQPEVLVFALEDDFGSYGQIAVCVLGTDSGSGTIMLRNMVVSCRVFGRGVEHSILKYLQSRLSGDFKSVEVPFVRSDKNGLAEGIVAQCLALIADSGDRLVFEITRDTLIPKSYVHLGN